jgi:hypothetical protein
MGGGRSLIDPVIEPVGVMLMPDHGQRQASFYERVRSRAPSIVGLAITAVIAAVIPTLVISLLSTPDVEEEEIVEPALAGGALARHPLGEPSRRFRLFISSSQGLSPGAWLLTAEGTTETISFRQSATVFLRLRPATDHEIETRAARQAPIQDLAETNVICVSIFANAFEITGVKEACTTLTGGESAHSWAWSLQPGPNTAGEQPVAVLVSATEPQDEGPVPAQRFEPAAHQSRFLTIEVARSIFDRYTTLIAAAFALIATLGAALIGQFGRKRDVQQRTS